jgi:ubiquinone/menaquinone biosynthesis C-methylase UbiE
MKDNKEAINSRYSQLAGETCCLSCGGAADKVEIKAGDICLDLGSGRGTDVLRMAEKTGETGFVFGLDISDGMITKGKKTAEKLGIHNVEFLQSELETIPIADKTVDVVISNCTINHADDKEKVWSEIYRILRNGGGFVVSDIYSENPVPDEYANDPEAVAECWAGAIVKGKYLEILEKCGFKEVEILEESTPYEKGQIKVSSFTIQGKKSAGCCCGS